MGAVYDCRKAKQTTLVVAAGSTSLAAILLSYWTRLDSDKSRWVRACVCVFWGKGGGCGRNRGGGEVVCFVIT